MKESILAVEDDADSMAVQHRDDVGQPAGVFGRGQVDGAAQRFGEQRGDRGGAPVDRFRRAAFSGQIGLRARAADVVLGEEDRRRQGDRGAGDVGVAGAGRDDGAQRAGSRRAWSRPRAAG